MFHEEESGDSAFTLSYSCNQTVALLRLPFDLMFNRCVMFAAMEAEIAVLQERLEASENSQIAQKNEVDSQVSITVNHQLISPLLL